MFLRVKFGKKCGGNTRVNTVTEESETSSYSVLIFLTFAHQEEEYSKPSPLSIYPTRF
jgi:hypothetical protein